VRELAAIAGRPVVVWMQHFGTLGLRLELFRQRSMKASSVAARSPSQAGPRAAAFKDAHSYLNFPLEALQQASFTPSIRISNEKEMRSIEAGQEGHIHRVVGARSRQTSAPA
jgi:hypothetical protein